MSLPESERPFWLIATAVFCLLIVVNYLPALWGEVPFPRDLVFLHKAYDGLDRPPREPIAQLGDIVTMFYPFRALQNQAVRDGVLPLWNPYLMSGSPFQANSQSALFYPPHIVYYLLPLITAWTASFGLRLLLAGLFMTLFIRSIGGSRAGAIVSGIIFAFCGFITEWQGQASGDAGIWLPLICYGVHRLHHDARFSSLAIAAFAFAMPVVAGHPETGAHSTFTAAVLAVMLWLFPVSPGVRRFDGRFALRFIAAGVLALGLASVQMIPTLEWLHEMGPQFDVAWPALDRHQGQGFFSRDIMSDPSSAGIAIPEGAAYAGMFGLLAASFALFSSSRRYFYFFAGITAVAVAVAFSVPPVQWMVSHIPIVKALKNGRLILVADFAIAAMAGLGITTLGRDWKPMPSQARTRALVILGATFLLSLFCIYEVNLATAGPVEFMRSPWGSVIFLVGSALLLLSRVLGKLPPNAFATLACLLAAVEMVSFSYGYFGFARRSEVFPPAPVFEFLRSRGDPSSFRVAKHDWPIPHDSGLLYGFDSADGYELTTERVRRFSADMVETRADGVMFRAEKILQTADRRMDMLNMKYFVVGTPSPEFEQMTQRPDRFTAVFKDAGLVVFENKFVLPRAFAVPVSGIESIAGADAQLERLRQPSFDPQQSVLFSTQPAGIPIGNGAPFRGNVDVVQRGLNGYTLHSAASHAAVIVLSQVYYPGWKAVIDGGEVPVYPVDYALTGVIAPAGEHEIRFSYEPITFKISAALSLISLAACCVLVGYDARRR